MFYPLLCGSNINDTQGAHQSHFWSALVFLLCFWGWNKGECAKGRKRRSGNYFSLIIISWRSFGWKSRSHPTLDTAALKIFSAACVTRATHGVTFWFQEEQLNLNLLLWVLRRGKVQNTMLHGHYSELKVKKCTERLAGRLQRPLMRLWSESLRPNYKHSPRFLYAYTHL